MRDKPSIQFTLVHGTFSKKAPWVSGDGDPSRFRARLKAELDRDYEVSFDDEFTWGHDPPWRFLDNTVSARLKAGEALAGHLSRPTGDSPSQRYIVAHSHGGNVALYALRHAAARRNVDGLVSLATPFLFSEKRPIGYDVIGISALLLIVFAIGEGRGLDPLWAVPLWLYTALFTLLAVTILFFGRLPKNKAHLEKIEEQDQALRFPARAELIGRNGSPFVGVVRVKKDEVGALMSFAYSLGGWIRAAWERVNLTGKRFLFLYMATVFPARWIGDKFDLSVEWLDPAASAFDKFLMTPLLLLATLVVTAMVVLRFSFAFDAPRWVASFDTRSEETPWPGQEPKPIHVSLDPDTKGWLRHTKIQGPAAEEIAKLVRAANTVVQGTRA